MHLIDDIAPQRWDDVAALAPAGFAAALEVHRTMWDRADPVLLELARLRIAQLLGAPASTRSSLALERGLDEGKIDALPQWPTSPSYDERERACLTVTEQFMVDVNGVSDADVDRLLEHMSAAECNAFVSALWAFEQMQRLCLVLGVEPPPEALGLRSHPAPDQEATA